MSKSLQKVSRKILSQFPKNDLQILFRFYTTYHSLSLPFSSLTPQSIKKESKLKKSQKWRAEFLAKARLVYITDF